mmetsp:Transcript_90892/g.294085  ORF Transcript_90892/g.294085 Transcript_90892/m.294085 type:complete len:205 (-) Transcript_90892:3-617(-)
MHQKPSLRQGVVVHFGPEAQAQHLAAAALLRDHLDERVGQVVGEHVDRDAQRVSGGLQRDVVAPGAVSGHVGQVVLEAPRHEAAVAFGPSLELLQHLLADGGVVLLRAVELVGQGPKLAVAVPQHRPLADAVPPQELLEAPPALLCGRVLRRVRCPRGGRGWLGHDPRLQRHGLPEGSIRRVGGAPPVVHRAAQPPRGARPKRA